MRDGCIGVRDMLEAVGLIAELFDMLVGFLMEVKIPGADMKVVLNWDRGAIVFA